MMKICVVLLGVFITATISGFAGTMLNVKSCETSFMHYYKRMEQEGKTSELSPEFLAVINGMKKGTYTFDRTTALKAMQQLYPRKEAIVHPKIAEKFAAAQKNQTQTQTQG